MGMAQLVVTAVLVEGRSKAEVARDYGVSRRWVITLVQRFLTDGEAGLQPRSRRPRHSPGRTAQVVEDEIVAWGEAEPTLEAVLTRLGDYAMVGATLLTAFNDNAAVTFLASTVPNLPEAVKYSVVAGAVTGGGLTVIANAPNPAGQAILGKYFKGINPLWLFAWAAFPTAIVFIFFTCFGH